MVGFPEDLARTINTLLVCKGLSLLRFVPFYDEPITNGEGSAGIGSPNVESAKACEYGEAELMDWLTARHS